MHRVPATIEEQLFLKAIKEECPWENLPKRLQATFSKEEWTRRVIDYCIKKRLQWNTCFARKLWKEGDYYEEMMRYLRKSLALFPYHLAEYICRVLRVSPFRYYCDMIFEVMKNEQPYDSIPNFSAADALRLTGIGRNEFIDLMNKCRSKKIMWKLNKSIAKELLPTQPVDFAIEPWWGVCLVNFTLEEFRKLTEEEASTIDKICKEEGNSYFLFDAQIIKGLYQRGLIYFDVPVYPDDRFKVCRLEGFVSNREQSYEDPIEELLYAVFVVSNENATVAELASTLQADLSQLQTAASFACRLGWAVKVIDPASVLQELNLPASLQSDEDVGSRASASSADLPADGSRVAQGHDTGLEKMKGISGPTRVAFLVDANITSYLMMGSVSPGLKSHAVTLYEAGKLGDASIADLCKDLTTLEGTKFEGELQEFANHAFSLRCVLQCLKSGVISDDTLGEAEESSEILCESEDGTEISLACDNTISLHDDAISNSTEAQTTTNDSHLQLSPHENLKDENECAESVSSSNSIERLSSEHVATNNTDKLEDLKIEDKLVNDEKVRFSDLSDIGNSMVKKKGGYHVDVLRCESLAGLAPATLDRLFNRDYDIIISMIPLPSTSVLPGAAGPIHFGPPTYSSMTPWMKLVLYSSAGIGPLSVVLVKGQRLRLLPAPLAGCAKALIWSWDGSTAGGLGGKFEGNLVSGTILLHCLNSLLKYSAVLVQPLNKYDLDDSGKPVTKDIALPLKNGSLTHIGKETGLCDEESAKLEQLLNDLSIKIKLWTIGYIRLIKLCKVKEVQHHQPENEDYEWVPLSIEFGIPLFNPKLCSTICQKIASSDLLQSESLSEHYEAMHALRKRLVEICSEYHATGPVARVLYQREQAKDSTRHLLNYASGRWKLESSVPIMGTVPEHQRHKLWSRQRGRFEILIFDGSILRSYALPSLYEAAACSSDDSSLHESQSSSTTHGPSDDADSQHVPLPGLNLVFDGSQLNPFDICACLQARQPVSLIAEASATSMSMMQRR
ncbi:uncharacterized protein LOC116258737 isoform X1 [Nymphaea colorata]|nr:uncharacterized protein LOC116258737 isoform X1 [Nymphaea colorata]XP_031491949.1 uncharacterized protein LOC116258737 isoform X1 [Nymphaea colorata]XP_031491950.1 uncharacterized protein LOC116258737 isoform X1 [Nymphaea colorata]XP_049935063.1 uncharacterized protein LOC116258737 isoform X1 [Nymphaea colorata]